MSTTMTRRLGKLEETHQARVRHRAKEAFKQVAHSLTPDHARSIREWILDPKVMKVRCGFGHAGNRFCVRCIEAANPPGLVRAIWVMVFEYIDDGTPMVLLPPEVAQVYIDHPDVAPGEPCEDCGYLLPSRNGRLAYDGACPGCSLLSQGRR